MEGPRTQMLAPGQACTRRGSASAWHAAKGAPQAHRLVSLKTVQGHMVARLLWC